MPAVTCLKPLELQMGQLTERSVVYRALNQLCSVTAGRKWARVTDSLKDDPAARVQKCIELTLFEAMEATSGLRNNPDSDKLAAQANRKLDSLRSLAVLARVIQDEVHWDD